MTTRRYLLAAIPLYALVLATLFVPSLLVSPVSASHTPANPFPWRVYGPESQFLRFQYYASAQAEFTALTTGGPDGIDLYDFPLSIAQVQQIQGDPTLSANIDVTVNVDEFGMRQIDVNQHNSFFGVPADNGNSPITHQLIAAITHMIDKERWIIEGPVGGLASRIDTPDAAGHFVDVDDNPANGVQGYSPAWDTLHAGTISAFNLVAEPVGTFGIPPVGTSDFCAAADHVVEFGRLAALAGHFGGVNPFSDTPGTVRDDPKIKYLDANGNSVWDAGEFVFYDGNANGAHEVTEQRIAGTPPGVCVVTGWTPAMGQLIYATRNEAGDIRTDLGTRHTAAIEALFNGANVVNEIFGNIDQLRPVVFQHCAVCSPGAHTYTASSVRDWHLYTGGWGLGGFADHIWFLYGNTFSGRANQALNAQGLANANCGTGNPQFRFPLNYPGFCRADYDPVAFEASLAALTVPAHVSAVNRAEAINGRVPAVIPILAFSSPRAALKDAQYTIAIGDGVHTFPTWMLARPRNAADNGQFDFGGPGTANDNIIRQGNREGTTTLNMFQAFSPVEFQVISAIYDSMLFQNPDAPTQQFFDWQSKTHSSVVAPTAAQLGYAPPAGTEMTTRWELKPGILFHDGSTLNALDVAFTAIAYRDAPATNLGSLFSEMLNVTIVDCGDNCGQPPIGLQPRGGPGEPLILDIHWSSATFFHELNSGGAPILPLELWKDPAGASVALWGGFSGNPFNVVGKVDTAKTALGYDPMVAGTLVGTGPWLCRDLSNPARIGGGCARTASGTPDDDALGPGSTLTMEGNSDYFRVSPTYKAFSWADALRDNNFWGTPALPAHRHPDILGDGWVSLVDLTAFIPCLSSVDPTNVGTSCQLFGRGVGVGARLSDDPLLKYVDAKGNNVMDMGESVVYDADGNNMYDAGERAENPRDDPRIKYPDMNVDGVWNPNEFVVYDDDGDGVYEVGELVVKSGTAVSIYDDVRIRYADFSNDGTWAAGEAVLYDTNADGEFAGAGAAFVAPGAPAETVIVVGGALPAALQKDDPKIKYLDTNANGIRNVGESTVYDTDSDGVYDADEPVIAGPNPAPGTPGLVDDAGLRYIDSNDNSVWEMAAAGQEPVFYSTDIDLVFDCAVLTGCEPVLNPKDDPMVKFVDANGNLGWNMVQNRREAVVYDPNTNGVYDIGEPVMILADDPSLLYVSVNINGVWDIFEPVVYDDDGVDRVYEVGETLISGGVSVFLKDDPLVKYVDIVNNGVHDRSDSVVYDSNGNERWEENEPVISRSPNADYWDLSDVPSLAGFSSPDGAPGFEELSLFVTFFDQDIYSSIGPELGVVVRNDPRTSVIGADPFDPFDEADFHL